MVGGQIVLIWRFTVLEYIRSRQPFRIMLHGVYSF